jgi:dTDP-4-amino-4,6-dideoxygalactose transaminase
VPRPLYVARPMLPDLCDLQPILNEIWCTRTLTNGGPFHRKLERELERYLGVPCAMVVNNGTTALLLALKMLNLPVGSEVITTPVTFAATAHAVCWNGLIPVFADIDPLTLTIDPASAEKAITRKTSAILAVHIYGTICDVEALQTIADRRGLRLIYDAAHAFGATFKGRSVAALGDASVFSFHATKLFHTLEGGLIATTRPDDTEAIYYLRNFGIKNEEEVVSIGINGKLNEIQAAIGLLNLPLVKPERSFRATLRERYCEFFRSVPGITLPVLQPEVCNSEQYFHIVINPGLFGRTRDDVYESLKLKKIFSRKYFHPVCTDFTPYRGYKIHSVRDEPYVNVVKSQVLCLPFHSGVGEDDFKDICGEFMRNTRAL